MVIALGQVVEVLQRLGGIGAIEDRLSRRGPSLVGQGDQAGLTGRCRLELGLLPIFRFNRTDRIRFNICRPLFWEIITSPVF